MKRTILHVDMNNFYASVETILNPSLKNYAVAVAGAPEKRTGIILAKNYIAKAYGIKTGDVIWEAKLKCPTLICVAPHHDKYQEFSERALKIYYQYTDIIEPFGIDECWLDVTNSLKFFNCDGLGLARRIQQHVKEELGLSVSIGISFGKTLAKLGSDMRKPMGLTVIDEHNHIEILKQSNVEDIIMIGKHTAKKLHSMNINTLFDLSQQKEDFIKLHFGVIGEYLLNSVLGINDDVLITPKDEDTKSVGNGATAVKDMTTTDEIKNFLHDLADKVSHRLRTHKFSAKTLHLTIKYADFTCSSAQNTYNHYFSNEQDIFEFAFEIFTMLAGNKFPPVRALRITTTNLVTDSVVQTSLFTNEKNENLCSAIDNIREKYGDNSIGFAKDY